MVLGYGVGLVAFGVALAVRFWVDDTLPPGFPFVTFFPAVIISAFLAGSRAGLLCAVLSFLSAWYWFVGEPGTFAITYGAGVGLGFFTFIAAVDIFIIEAVARAVDRLAAQQAQLNTIVETVPVGLVLAEFPSGRIVGGNTYIEETFGHPMMYSPDVDSYDEWVGFHEDGSRVDGHEYPLAGMLLRGEENPSIDVQRDRGDGSMAWVRILGRPVKDAAGRLTGGVVALIDIDEQRRTRDALEEALRTKELLLYEVNHRVKNSLQLVNSFLLLEASKIGDGEARAAVMTARNKVDLVARVHQLLYESGTHNGVDMRTAIEEIVHDLILSAGRTDVDLALDFSGDLMINIRQASPLVLVVNEIVTNALKYGLGSDRPRLTITVRNADNKIRLAIGDNGPGIAPPASGKKPGLGSQIVEGLVAQMRGKFVVESDGSGTTVILTLPIDSHSSDTKGSY